MGCFNSTGFISKLPILGGDRVVCFIGLQNQYGIDGHELWYPDSVVAPFFLPVRGEYNEYGSLCNIDDTPITKLLEKHGAWDIESILSRIERCLYGEQKNNTLDSNIKYWKKAKNKEEVNGYEKLKTLFRDVNVKPVLLFEHEDVYDKITETYFENTSGWSTIQPEDRIKLFYEAVSDYKDFYLKYKEKFDTDEFLGYILVDDMPKISYDGPYPFSRFRHVKEDDISHEGVVLHGKHKNHCTLVYSQLHKSLTFCDRLSCDELFDLYENCRTEIERYQKMWMLFSLSPMYIGFSKTAGEQNYNMDCLLKILTVCKDKASSMYEDYVERYKYEEDDE